MSTLRRVAVEVGLERLEEARATMLELFPEGFEEVDRPQGVELAAYTDAGGEERLWHFFGGTRATDVETGWEDRWRAFHRPVRIGALWIGPPWELPPAGALAIVVDPGRAFGTGSHPTTQLCLRFLQDLDRGSLLDVGCGSGVLSIAAALLGFEPVVGVDIEAPSIEATLANAAVNGVEVEARLVAAADPLPPASVAVAYLSLASVEALPERLEAATLVTSGYLASEQPQLQGFTHVERQTLDGWAADVHARD
jgi:ribosomal protein L11 methyltransferase